MNLRLCNFCGKEYRSKRPGKYCSQQCYNAYRESRKIYKQCTECGKVITRAPKHFAKVVKPFCSRSCQNKHMTRENHHAYVPKGKCPTCNTELTRTDVTYCSEACVPRTGEDNPKYLQRLDIPCDECGEMLQRTETLMNPTNFCTMECKNAYHARLMRGKNNPRYKNGMCKSYTRQREAYKGFTLKIRKAVRKRDNNTCQVCGKTKEEHGMNMHVHHVDYNKGNNSQDNLICVCRYCHGIIHGDENKWQEILLEKLK